MDDYKCKIDYKWLEKYIKYKNVFIKPNINYNYNITFDKISIVILYYEIKKSKDL